MVGLDLRNACYEGIKDAKKRELKTSEEYKKLVEEADQMIERSRNRYATAYKNAGSYLGN